MATPGFLSKRVKRKPQTGITTDRYEFLGLDQAEPDLGDPLVGPSSVGANPAPITGIQYVLTAYENRTGKRYWSPAATIVGSGLIPGSFTVFNNNVQVGLANSFNKFNFVGSGVTVDPVGFAATQQTGIATIRITVTDLTGPGNVYSIPYKGTSGLLVGANDFVYVSGNVGLGSTTPTTKLDVVGNASFTGIVTSFGGFVGNLTGTATTANNLSNAANITTGTISSSRLSGSYGIDIVGTATTANNLSNAANITTGTISSSRLSGSYGIDIVGTATTANNLSNAANITTGTISSSRLSGSYPISITGTATTANNVSSTININTTGFITANTFYGNLVGNISTTGQSFETINVTGISTFTVGPILLGSVNSTGTASQRLQVTGGTYISGSVGIGTTNPTSKLHVIGDANITGIVTASGFVGSGSSLSGLVSNVIAGVNTDLYHYFLISPQGSGTISSISASLNYIIFNPAAKFLGIGTDSPSANLDVSGTGKFSTSVTSLDFNTTSDSKLKTNIHQIENSLEKVIQIRGVTFDWKENNKSSAGVIAQDVERVLPEVVNGEDIKTVNYNGIIGVLVEAVKELKVENDILKEKLEKVYSKVFGEDTL